MASFSTPRLASLACSSLLSAVHCVLFARECWERRRGEAHSPEKAQAASEQSDKEFRKSVSDEVNVFLCKGLQGGGRVGGIFTILATLFTASKLLTGETPWINDEQYHFETAAHGCVMILRVCPAWLLSRILPLVYAMFMFCFSGYMFFVDVSNVSMAMRAMVSVTLFRIALGMYFSQIFSSLVCNVALAITNTYVFVRLQKDTGMEMGSIEVVGAFELMVVLYIVCLAIHGRRAFVRECSQLMKIQSLSIDSSAMTTLLELVCDVVVELDGSLCVQAHAPRLSAMLCLNRNTQGMPFVEHMQNDTDRERFKTLLCEKADDGAIKCVPGALNVTLRDSMANNIPVEIFYVASQSMPSTDSVKFFVGIREITDQPVAKLPPSTLTESVQAALARGRGRSERKRTRSAIVQGTAPVATRSALVAGRNANGDDDDNQSVSSDLSAGTSASQWKLLDERFNATSGPAKNLSVCELLTQFNIPIPRRSCCTFHAAITDMRKTVKALERYPCYATFRLVGNSQCTSCGLVLDADENDDSLEHCAGSPLMHAPAGNGSTQEADFDFSEPLRASASADALRQTLQGKISRVQL